MTLNFASPAPPSVNRASLHAEIEATQEAFHLLIASLTEEGWRTRRPGSNWTGRELLEHITFALEQLPKEVDNAKRGKGMFNFPKAFADPGSYWLTKWEARKSTRDSISRRYVAAIANALASLDAVRDEEWLLGARFYGEGFYSVADLFRTPANHFKEHAVFLR